MNSWIVLVVYIINGVIFGVITQYVAESKGYHGGFGWGFWLGIIGLLVVGFRPPIQADEVKHDEVASKQHRPIYQNTNGMLDKRADQKNADCWRCGCGTENLKNGLFCKKCGAAKPDISEWFCQACGRYNEYDARFCIFCGNKKMNVTQKEKNRVHKIITSEDSCMCSECGREQRLDRSKCFNCGAVFDGIKEPVQMFSSCKTQ